MEFFARVHGAKIGDSKGSAPLRSNPNEVYVPKELLFRDPKEYEKMPMEERKKLTEKMKGYYTKTLARERLA